MTVFPLLAVGFIMKMAAALLVICAVVLILIILVQKGKGGGLGGAFGGGVAGGILGSKTGDFLTWVTVVLAGLFLTLAVLMAKFYKPTISDYDVAPTVGQQAIPAEQQVPQQPLTPAETESSDINLPGT